MQNSLLFVFSLLSRQRSRRQVTPGYSINYLRGESNFSMACSCYSKPNFDILLGKVCWECPGISNSCHFSCLFKWEEVLFCFVTCFQHTAQVLPLQGSTQVLPLPSSLPEPLNFSWLWLNAVSSRDGWRFTLIHVQPKVFLLSLAKCPAFSQCTWTATTSAAQFLSLETPFTHKGWGACGADIQIPTIQKKKKKKKFSYEWVPLLTTGEMLVWKWGHNLRAKMKIRLLWYIHPALQAGGVWSVIKRWPCNCDAVEFKHR